MCLYIKVTEIKVIYYRLAIFSISAHNKLDCYERLEKIGKDLNIDVYNIINKVKKYEG